MIAEGRDKSNARSGAWRRRQLLAAAALLLEGCAVHPPRPALTAAQGARQDGIFLMADGAVLPYRAWLPQDRPRAVVLALHGFNDSRDAWELPAPAFAAAGIGLIAPDQRGFGAAPGRGHWPGTATLVADAAHLARLVRERFPGVEVLAMGESMGAAVLMLLATSPLAPDRMRYVLLAPAVWGRAQMNLFAVAALWLAATLAPGLRLTGAGLGVRASDNTEALIRLSEDPLTIHATRISAIRGLVDLMGRALEAAARFPAPGLFLYGGRDELVPAHAMAAAWRALRAGERIGFYPDGYHLLLRDHDRAEVIGDVVSWITDPAAPLPSGAEARARAWLAAHGGRHAPVLLGAGPLRAGPLHANPETSWAPGGTSAGG